MVKESKVCMSDDEFVPQWKHYEQLMFLRGCWDQDVAVDDLPLSPLTPHEETQSVHASPGLITSFLPNISTCSSSPCHSSSSCIPSAMIVKCYWTEERERLLIAFYSGNQQHWIQIFNSYMLLQGSWYRKTNLMTLLLLLLCLHRAQLSVE